MWVIFARLGLETSKGNEQLKLKYFGHTKTPRLTFKAHLEKVDDKRVKERPSRDGDKAQHSEDEQQKQLEW